MDTDNLHAIRSTPEHSRVYAIMNFKGGAGKTAFSLAMNTHVGKTGENSLLIDADPQRNASQKYGIRPDDHNINKLNMVINALRADLEIPPPLQIIDKKLRPVVGIPQTGAIGLVPGHLKSEIVLRILNDEHKLDSRSNSNSAVMGAFRRLTDRYLRYFGYIFIDTAPAIDTSMLCFAAASVADEIIIPVDGVEAALGLLRTMTWFEEEIYPHRSENMPGITVVMSKYQNDIARVGIMGGNFPKTDIRNGVHRLLKFHLPDQTCDRGVKELPRLRTSIYDTPANRNSKNNAYAEVCEEILNKTWYKRDGDYDGILSKCSEIQESIDAMITRMSGKYDIRTIELR